MARFSASVIHLRHSRKGNIKIAILGGGVAGVSGAIALKQNGFDVNVYERRESPSNIGAGIVVWPNASYVLEQLGVLNEIKAMAGYPSKMRRLSSTNEDLGAIDIGLINRHMGYLSLSILCSDFQNILVSKLESLGVAIHDRHAAKYIVTRSVDKAEIYFQNGEKIAADTIIGTDGRIVSYARLYVHDDNKPVYQGFINWIGVYESEEDTFLLAYEKGQ